MPARTRAERASARDARAKAARAFINKTVPALLKANARARRGVEAAERIVDPPPWRPTTPTTTAVASSSSSPPSLASSHPEEECVAASGELLRGGRRGERRDAHRRAPRRRQEHEHGDHPPPQMHITLQVADTLDAAARLVAEEALDNASHDSGSGRGRGCARRRHQQQGGGGRVAVLNMASPLRPGGGVLTGATSQEERLCARTTLYPSLRESFYRLPDVGGVYTPDVLVCRSWGDESSPSSSSSSFSSSSGGGGGGVHAMLLPPGKRFYVDVLTAAMLRMPDTTVQSVATADTEAAAATTTTATTKAPGEALRYRYSEPRDRELAHRQMRAALRILCGRGVTRVVLGAWGCGAYGNPVGEVARAWRAVLCGRGGEGWDGLRVVFAIRDAGLARAFADAFGLGLVAAAQDDGQGDDDNDGDGYGDEETDEGRGHGRDENGESCSEDDDKHEGEEEGTDGTARARF
ncbi:hypothetical protein JDV02_003966 [Purpureocillium takamizusanense]|uniref:Microbial-type PARG catalytic domain-containing protein n=1 Tax=Purpureocillium takamizusanense TaxID=2060973 RepID=A0A9Q8QDU0_9HYPO|nr:uncharacterized protein JDV02_003966 [Purpureocillium takamizusanense]UNI17638.1 hypothetical protein JDV02_003966 [Purpureocillium takamizusanense]